MKRKIFVSLLIGAGCLWLALRNVEWGEFRAAMKSVSLFPVLCMVFPLTATFWFRARRWRRMLLPLKVIETRELFTLTMIGFLAINVIPLRLGEVVRPLLLKRRYGIPMSAGFATIGIERVLDGLVAGLFLAIGILASPMSVKNSPLLGLGVQTMAGMMLAFFASILVFLLIAVIQRERALRIFRFFVRIIPHRFHDRVNGMAENFFAGLNSLPNMRSLFLIFMESVVVWGVMVITYWLGLEAFGFTLPWSAPFTVMGIAAVGVMLPGAPGMVGTYQLFVEGALMLYGIPKSTGLAYSIVVHAVNLTFICGLGFILLPRVTTRVKSLIDEAASTDLSAAQ